VSHLLFPSSANIPSIINTTLPLRVETTVNMAANINCGRPLFTVTLHGSGGTK